MTTKAQLEEESMRLRRAELTLRVALERVRNESNHAAGCGKVLNHIWLAQFITEQLTIAQCQKDFQK